MLRNLVPAAALLVAGIAGSAEAQFTCSTVARAGQLDPDGFFYTNTFRDEVAINASGDTVFVARAIGGRDKLYFYPGTGAGEVVARADGPAPNGGTFRSQRSFFFLSVNDAGNVAFFGALVAGQGVFVRDGGVLETAVVRSQASPAGGVFDSFPFVGGIDAASRVPFVATVDGGAGGVFVYDAASDAVSSLVLDGTATLDGREICSTQAVDLGSTGAAAIRATSKVSCTDDGETARSGIFLVSGLGVSTLVLDGDASAIGGTTYAKLLDTPRINADDDVAFRATTIGTTPSDAIFAWDFATSTVAVAVRKGDAAPVVGGSLSRNQSFRFADSGNVVLNARLQSAPARAGIFDLGITGAPALVDTDAPPSDAFGTGSRYVRLNPTSAASDDGLWVGVQVRVRDTTLPPSKAGVIRCEG